VANIGPASYNYDETLTTLRYANRAKNIQNKPRINEDPKDALLREFQEEIAKYGVFDSLLYQENLQLTASFTCLKPIQHACGKLSASDHSSPEKNFCVVCDYCCWTFLS